MVPDYMANYIDGYFNEGVGGGWIRVINPSNEECTSVQRDSTVADVDKAVAAARKAFPAWAARPAIERAGYLIQIADEIEKHKNLFANILMSEQGKTRKWAEIEVAATISYFRYMATFARQMEGEILQSDNPGETIFVSRKPIGVVAGILPWNFPLFLIARKAAAAMIAGCTIVMKPSQLTPQICFEFCRTAAYVKVPFGVINMVTGRGSLIGDALAGHPGIDIVSVTGSVGAGESIMKAAAKNITKVSLELGGKAPVIVFPDADLDLAAQAILDSRIGNNGQICNNAERLYVHKSVAKELTEKLLALFQAVKVGDPYSGADMGPLVEMRALESVEAKVKKAIEQGAKLLCGGHRVGDKGFFYAPTLLGDCRQDMDIIHEETFGPVLPIVEWEDEDQVLAWANDCEYGLASSIFTNDLNTAAKFVRGLDFGETYINRFHFEAIQGFHAGVKKSGIGGADGKHGVDEYLRTHVTYMQTK